MSALDGKNWTNCPFTPSFDFSQRRQRRRGTLAEAAAAASFMARVSMIQSLFLALICSLCPPLSPPSSPDAVQCVREAAAEAKIDSLSLSRCRRRRRLLSRRETGHTHESRLCHGRHRVCGTSFKWRERETVVSADASTTTTAAAVAAADGNQ